MITGVAIEEGEELATGGGVYYLVNAWQDKRIFRAMLIEIGVINAHPPFFILLLNKDWISQPIGMIHLFNEAGC